MKAFALGLAAVLFSGAAMAASQEQIDECAEAAIAYKQAHLEFAACAEDSACSVDMLQIISGKIDAALRHGQEVCAPLSEEEFAKMVEDNDLN